MYSEPYLNTHGLSHSGVAKYNRWAMTDFGSGWQGVGKMLSKFKNIFKKPPSFKPYSKFLSLETVDETAGIFAFKAQSGNYLKFSANEQGLHIGFMMGQHKRGEAFEMMKNMLNIAADAKRPVFSEGLVPNLYGEFEAAGKTVVKPRPIQMERFTKATTNWDRMMAVYPQMRYRQLPGVETSGDIILNNTKHHFNTLDDLKKLVNSSDDFQAKSFGPEMGEKIMEQAMEFVTKHPEKKMAFKKDPQKYLDLQGMVAIGRLESTVTKSHPLTRILRKATTVIGAKSKSRGVSVPWHSPWEGMSHDAYIAALLAQGVPPSQIYNVESVGVGVTSLIHPEDELYRDFTSGTKTKKLSRYIRASAEMGEIVHHWEQSRMKRYGQLGYAELKIEIGQGVHSFVDAIDTAGNVVEIKSIGEERLKQINRPYPMHIAQIQMYMHALNKEQGIIRYISREDLSFRKEFAVEYNPEEVQEQFQKLSRVRKKIIRNLRMGRLSFSDIAKPKPSYYYGAPAYKPTHELNLEEATQDYYSNYKWFKQIQRPVPSNLNEILRSRIQQRTMQSPYSGALAHQERIYNSMEVAANADNVNGTVASMIKANLYVRRMHEAKQLRDLSEQMTQEQNGHFMISSNVTNYRRM